MANVFDIRNTLSFTLSMLALVYVYSYPPPYAYTNPLRCPLPSTLSNLFHSLPLPFHLPLPFPPYGYPWSSAYGSGRPPVADPGAPRALRPLSSGVR